MIFISVLSLVAMILVSCSSTFAPDETATTGVTRQADETQHERSAEDSVNSISGGHYSQNFVIECRITDASTMHVTKSAPQT